MIEGGNTVPLSRPVWCHPTDTPVSAWCRSVARRATTAPRSRDGPQPTWAGPGAASSLNIFLPSARLRLLRSGPVATRRRPPARTSGQDLPMRLRRMGHHSARAGVAARWCCSAAFGAGPTDATGALQVQTNPRGEKPNESNSRRNPGESDAMAVRANSAKGLLRRASATVAGECSARRQQRLSAGRPALGTWPGRPTCCNERSIKSLTTSRNNVEAF
jgi:hypothetical protein